MLFVVSLLLGLVNSQSSSDCVYRQGPGLELDLLTFKGKYLSYDAGNIHWSYTICADSLECLHESVAVNAMVEAHPEGINECHYFAMYNESLQPFYDVCLSFCQCIER